MMTARDYKSTLREGPYAWPGGYPMFLAMSDGECLCFECARANAREILTEIHMPGSGDSGWQPECFGVNWEDPELYCAHCYKRIESAYAED